VRIAPDDPRTADIRDLLGMHLSFAYSHSGAEHVHALDIDGLLDPAVAFFSYREHGELLAVGALKQLEPGHAEIKSMHTAQAARGRGIGRAMLDRLIALARKRGCTRVSLETGAIPAFAAARALYASAGFVPCGPFGEYAESPFNTFMTLTLNQTNTPV
jgi:putative acetyltransferase